MWHTCLSNKAVCDRWGVHTHLDECGRWGVHIKVNAVGDVCTIK